MKKFSGCIKDTLIMLGLLAAAFGVSLLFQYIFQVQEHVTTVFVFAVFLISLLTKGYAYGIVSAFLGTVAVNYAFTFPYFKLDFAIPVNLISGIVMIVIAVLTGALTTEVKRHEAMKAESEKERMRANLLRAVSHDLRTPLTTIYASGTTLLENTGLTDDQRTRITRGITEDAQWLMRMVENLLSVTRIDTGAVELIKTPTVLEELIDSVVLKFKKRYPGQQVHITLPEEMVIIPMDAILIEQVIINLLENAVQHATGMKNLSLTVSLEGNTAVFAVADDGCGVDPRRLETIFTGSYSENADSQKRNAGIGLSVCATIIKAHAGTIRAENRAGGGAVFRFGLLAEEASHDPE